MNGQGNNVLISNVIAQTCHEFERFFVDVFVLRKEQSLDQFATRRIDYILGNWVGAFRTCLDIGSSLYQLTQGFYSCQLVRLIWLLQ